MSTKSRLCKIIPAQVTDMVNGAYILSLPDGEQYKVEGGSVPLKKGSLIRFEKDSFLKLTNEVVDDNLEEITILKDESNDEQTMDMDSNTQFVKEKNAAVWQDASTRVLIDLYKELRPNVNGHTIRTMKNMWEKISNRLQEHGYSFDYQQVESKWKSLVRSYRSGLIQGTKRKSHYQAGPFEYEIGEILTSQGVSFEVVNVDDNHDDDVDLPKHVACSSPPDVNRKSPISNNNEKNSNDMLMLVKAINKRTTQKEMADAVKQEQRERLISAIQERNQLLKKIFLQRESR